MFALKNAWTSVVAGSGTTVDSGTFTPAEGDILVVWGLAAFDNTKTLSMSDTFGDGGAWIAAGSVLQDGVQTFSAQQIFYKVVAAGAGSGKHTLTSSGTQTNMLMHHASYTGKVGGVGNSAGFAAHQPTPDPTNGAGLAVFKGSLVITGLFSNNSGTTAGSGFGNNLLSQSINAENTEDGVFTAQTITSFWVNAGNTTWASVVAELKSSSMVPGYGPDRNGVNTNLRR